MLLLCFSKDKVVIDMPIMLIFFRTLHLYANKQDSIASLDADLLKIATNGWGTDERLVVSILCSRTKAQLDAIDLIYRERFHQTLREYIEKEMGGDLSEMLSYTQMKEDELDAFLLRKAFQGVGCNKELVVEIVCTRSAARLQNARLVAAVFVTA
jgi:hypothetical protein